MKIAFSFHVGAKEGFKGLFAKQNLFTYEFGKPLKLLSTTFELDGPATNLKLTVVKIAGILKGSTKDVKEDENMQMHEPLEVSGRKRKRLNAIQFKTRFKPQ
uniref:Uncharacterized protein n=1 Tax=Tanacetum cinerariifolium TaxID=118510 RepID=A0A699ICP7_TANCI|nr:hypothetical protein [Tanacetum cinerariifolium]